MVTVTAGILPLLKPLLKPLTRYPFTVAVILTATVAVLLSLGFHIIYHVRANMSQTWAVTNQ